METKEDSKAWCPACGDEMFIVQDKLGKYCQWHYYCFGCDDTYKFEKIVK